MADETEFVHQPITVEYEKAAVGPTALRWGGSLRRVTEVVRQWQDFHTPPYATHATGWLHRRHRNYYLLRLEGGDVVEVYLDRAGGRREWMLLKRHVLSLSALSLGSWPTNGFALRCELEAAIVDPAADARRLLAAAEGARVMAIVLTHGHPDHTGALAEVRAATGAPVLMHAADAGEFGIQTDRFLHDGDAIRIGYLDMTVVHTPGHTPGSICLRFDHRALVGDTIFPGGPGHTDSPQALTMLRKTLAEKVFAWPDETRFLPGHGNPGTIGVVRPAYLRFARRRLAADAFGDLEWGQAGGTG